MDGRPRLAEEALVAVTLLVAESAPREKDTVVRLVAYLLEEQQTDGSEDKP